MNRSEQSGFILAMDSSSRLLSLALGAPEGKIWTEETDRDFRHEEAIVGMIDKLLKGAGVGLGQVGRIAVGRGPGSFTGVRVGLSSVKALVLSCRMRCFLASSLDVIARQALSAAGSGFSSVRVLVDARRSRYYTTLFRAENGAFLKVSDDEILDEASLARTLGEGTILLGDGLKTFHTENIRIPSERIRILPEEFWYPHARTLIEWVRSGGLGLPEVGLDGIVPAYLGLTEPEERMRQTQRT